MHFLLLRLTTFAVCVLLVMSTGGPTHSLEASSSAVDYTEMSLEDLMNESFVQSGVLGGHTHYEGDVMVGYHYMLMHMAGNRDGTRKVPVSEILGSFMMSPINMVMHMHMFNAMYAFTDEITVMAMVPYLVKSMDTQTKAGMRFTTNSQGLGDITLMPMYTVHKRGDRIIFVTLGVSLPTGSITKRDDTPMAANSKLPYPMQLGSGTYDLQPGVTYTDQTEEWAWGARGEFDLHLGKNKEGYCLGNSFHAVSWLQRKIFEWLAASVLLEGNFWGNISGSDSDLMPTMSPTANPKLRAGSRVDLLVGLHSAVTEGTLSGNRFSVEGGVPVYQHLTGPQLEVDWLMRAVWEWTF